MEKLSKVFKPFINEMLISMKTCKVQQVHDQAKFVMLV